MTPQQQQEAQKKAARAFVTRWQEAEGSEQQEAAKFWLELFTDVLGVANPTRLLDFERRVRGRRIDVFHEDVGVLIEHKSRGIDLDAPEPRGKEKSGAPRLVTPFEQAKWYADNITPRSIAPRWLITCNFDEIRIHDLDDERAEETFERIPLAELPELVNRLSFLTRKENSRLEREKQLSVAAGEVVGRLYDALAAGYLRLESDPDEQRSLNILMTRIVFLLYAEDAGLLHETDAFYKYLVEYKAGQMAAALRDLFAVLKTPEQERDPYLGEALKRFPYINGGLFEQSVTIPQFTDAARELLLREASAGFDWKGISPTIFGAVFESTLNPATRRAGGMHYTSIENIHKVIDPLFLDDLNAELRDMEGEKNKGAKTRQEWTFRLTAFRKKIAALRIFDPACGSGNFLTETYLCLRHLENRVLQNLYTVGQGVQMTFAEADPVQVGIHQFYGIEINDFAVEVAKTALWIAELQALEQTREILGIWLDPLPLKDNAGIHCANALRINWNDVLPAGQCSYVIGNPPFVGHQWRTKEQQADMQAVFAGWNNYGKLDYVASWYAKAAEYGDESKTPFAFVSTNSICQGEVVRTLWEPLFAKGYQIHFAYPTFVWNSETTDQAHVHVVIVACSKAPAKSKTIFYASGAKPVGNINGYLADAPNIFIESRGKPVNAGVPEMTKGSQPTDGGNLILSVEEKNRLISAHPQLQYVIRQYMGGNEFINGILRYCLWFDGADIADYESIPEIRRRLDAVRAMRTQSPTASVQKDAATPWLFTQRRQPESAYLAVPEVSSERRQYIPVGFIKSDIIASNQLRFIPTDSMFIFGLLLSKAHMAWMRTVSGRLKSDYRYSPAVWNSFVFPQCSNAQKQQIETCAQAVLDARAEHPDATLAGLYDPDNMPANLRAAHQHLDAAVEAAYGVNFGGDEERIVEHLFTLYAQAAADRPERRGTAESPHSV